MKTKMKSVLLVVVSFVFALCLSVVCALGFEKPAYTVSANTATTLKMEDGAQVRLATPTGLRFTASISTEDYEAVKANNGTFGMFILPNAYRETVGEINEANAFTDAKYCWGGAVDGKTQIVHCATDNLVQTSADGETTYFACALTNIRTENYEVDFFARAYYEVNGTRVWADLNETNVRSVSYVAQKVLGMEKAGEYTPTMAAKTALVGYVAQFVEVSETVSDVALGEGEAALYVADIENVSSIAIDGETVDYDYASDREVLLSGLTTGRHTATVTLADDSTWDVPFVYANYVIRTSADVYGLIALYTANTNKITKQYIVMANDVIYTDAQYCLPSNSNAIQSTFDGYGHTLTNFACKAARFGLLGHLNGSHVLDFAMVNVSIYGNSNASALCGAMSNGASIKNVFISGKYAGAAALGSNVFHLMATRCAGADNGGYIDNCVVVDLSDTGYANKSQAALTRFKDGYVGGITNTVVVTDGLAVSNEADATTEKLLTLSDTNAKIGSNDANGLAAALKALAEKVDEDGTKLNNWTYNETTTELSLCGNVIFTVDD